MSLFFFYYFKTGISIGCSYNKVLPFTFSALSGTLSIVYFSKQIEDEVPFLKTSLYYIGNPCYWWIIYSVAGISIPLLLNKVWQITINKMLWIKQ